MDGSLGSIHGIFADTLHALAVSALRIAIDSRPQKTSLKEIAIENQLSGVAQKFCPLH